MTLTLELIDFSVFQGSPNWDAVAGSGLAGGLGKASEGVGFEDRQWQRNQAALLSPGPLVGGSYHFLRPDLGNDPVAEADWYLARHDARCFEAATPWIFALDAESAGGSDPGCKAFMARVQARTGYPCWFYSYSSWIRERGITPSASPLWLAWPDGNGPNPPSFGWPVITMQQYGVRSVPGIEGNVDANRFFGDLDQLRALAGAGSHSGGGPPVNPPPAWDGSYPMPDPPPAGTGVDVVYRGQIMPQDGAGRAPRWADAPDGTDMGAAPIGAGVTVGRAAWDGANWWDRIEPGTWWLLDSAIDGTDAAHPGGQTPVTAWNEAHRPEPAPAPDPGPAPAPDLQTQIDDLEARVTKLEQLAPKPG